MMVEVMSFRIAGEYILQQRRSYNRFASDGHVYDTTYLYCTRIAVNGYASLNEF